MSTPDPNPARERHWVCAQRLRDRRRALGLTQREVVDRLHRCGNRTTNRALSAMENGRGLDLGLLPDLAESLSCSVTYLLGLTADPDEWHPACRNENRPPREPLAEVSRQGCAGILGPNVPSGFAAPVRTRRRAVAEVTTAAEAMADPRA